MNDYQRIARVITYLDECHAQQPSLNELAELVDLSPFHFHRMFRRWAGVTPKEFLKCLTLSHARQMLQEGQSVLQTSYDVGLSGPGRLHDLCISLEAASPGELKSGGDGWSVTAGLAGTPFGHCLVGVGPRGICYLSFVKAENRQDSAAAIQASWPRAEIRWNDDLARRLIRPAFTPHTTQEALPLRAYVRGSEFQLRVWRALLKVPCGTVVSYRQIAKAIDAPSASRAVGTAVASNPLAYLIPCHRVIRGTGVIGDFRWDRVRKRAMVAWESAKARSQQLEPI